MNSLEAVEQAISLPKYEALKRSLPLIDDNRNLGSVRIQF